MVSHNSVLQKNYLESGKNYLLLISLRLIDIWNIPGQLVYVYCLKQTVNEKRLADVKES